jgi:hypothetical protein
MALEGPNDEDRRKLHAEVNQLVSQRLALTTLAVTIFTGVAAWTVPRALSQDTNSHAAVWFLLSVVLLFFEFVLFGLGHQLTWMIRTITSYLYVVDRSGWERDWALYRQSYPEYWGYTKPQAIVFLALGILGGFLPIIPAVRVLISLCAALSHPTMVGVFWFIWLSFYLTFVTGMGFFRWFANEDKIFARWRELDGKAP